MIFQAMTKQDVISTEAILTTPRTKEELGKEYFPLVLKYIDLLPKDVITNYLRAVVLGNLYLEKNLPYPAERQASRRLLACAVIKSMEELGDKAVKKAQELEPDLPDWETEYALERLASGIIKL